MLAAMLLLPLLGLMFVPFSSESGDEEGTSEPDETEAETSDDLLLEIENGIDAETEPDEDAPRFVPGEELDGNDLLVGTEAGDTILGSHGADTLEGGDGNDILMGDAATGIEPDSGFLPVDSFQPVDPETASDGDDEIDGGAGDDTIHGNGGDDLIHGGDGNDSIEGYWGADTIHAGDGDDQVNAGTGNDFVDAGAGDDYVFLGTSEVVTPSTVYGGEGADSLSGSSGDNDMFGGDGKDSINGQGGNDYIDGGKGNDILRGRGGADTILGGGGNDTIYDDAYESFVRDPNAPGHSQYYNLPGGGPGVVDGGAGDDNIDVLGGTTITGGAGADQITVTQDLTEDFVTVITDFDPDKDELSFDLIVGADQSGEMRLEDWPDETGADLYLGETLVARITGAAGLDAAEMVNSITVVPSGTSFTGSDGDDAIYGSYDDDTIYGLDGDDLIDVRFEYETSGQDLVDGGAGNDTIHAQGGLILEYDHYDVVLNQSPDTLSGGDGDDVLTTDTGGGVMTGGAGADVFGISDPGIYEYDVYGYDEGTDEDYLIETRTMDFPTTVITDFEPGEDRIVLFDLESDDIEVVVWEDGTGADILAGGHPVAHVTGGQTLTTDDIALVNYRSEVA